MCTIVVIVSTFKFKFTNRTLNHIMFDLDHLDYYIKITIKFKYLYIIYL